MIRDSRRCKKGTILYQRYASGGIGSLIVFIALVLVAAIAASVIIQTANQLETQAMKSGQDVREEVSTGFHVKEIVGHMSNNVVDKLTIMLSPRPGSGAIDLKEAYITISNGVLGSLLHYNESIFSILREDTSSNVFTTMITSGGGSGGDWWDTNWGYRKQITVDADTVDADLTNFPVLIDLASDSGLANHAQNDGDDIVFVNDSGTQLDHEIESFNGGTGELQAWVRIPSLSSSSDTVLYMYYGNSGCSNQQKSTGVWDDSYSGIWHMNTMSWEDSTSNYNDGVGSGEVDITINGKVDSAGIFDGFEDYIYINPTGSVTGSFTVEAWVMVTDYGTRNFFDTRGDAEYGFDAKFQDGTTIHGDIGNGGDWITTEADAYVNYQVDTWYHVAYVVTPFSYKIYFGGDQIGSGSYSLNIPILFDDDHDIYIGQNNIYGEYFYGCIDEVRISNIARSSAWITTCYTMMNNNAAFFTLDEEETNSGGNQTLTLFDLSNSEFGIYVVCDYDGSCTASSPVINKGDLVILTVNVQEIFNGIPVRTKVQGTIQAETGTPGMILFTTPVAFSEVIYKLQY